LDRSGEEVTTMEEIVIRNLEKVETTGPSSPSGN
jgi:hypothetical protein